MSLPPCYCQRCVDSYCAQKCRQPCGVAHITDGDIPCRHALGGSQSPASPRRRPQRAHNAPKGVHNASKGVHKAPKGAPKPKGALSPQIVRYPVGDDLFSAEKVAEIPIGGLYKYMAPINENVGVVRNFIAYTAPLIDPKCTRAVKEPDAPVRVLVPAGATIVAHRQFIPAWSSFIPVIRVSRGFIIVGNDCYPMSNLHCVLRAFV